MDTALEGTFICNHSGDKTFSSTARTKDITDAPRLEVLPLRTWSSSENAAVEASLQGLEADK